MDWLEDTEHFEEAHRALDEAGRFIRQTFGCSLTFKEGEYRQECPVALAHNRIGMSIGAIVKKVTCSICRCDPHDCSHVTGRTYGGERCVRIVEEAELLEVSLVDRPSMPDARILSMTIPNSELKSFSGQNSGPVYRYPATAVFRIVEVSPIGHIVCARRSSLAARRTRRRRRRSPAG
jgi:hypothetical protein